MVSTTEQLLRNVRAALENGVLAHLDPAGWPASNVRSCLMLLTYAEDRVIGEDAALRDGNALMADFLSAVRAGSLGLEGFRTEVTEGLGVIEALPMPVTTAELRHRSLAYKTLLTRLVWFLESMRAAPGSGGSPEYSDLRLALQSCLSAVHSQEYGLVERAQEMVPL